MSIMTKKPADFRRGRRAQRRLAITAALVRVRQEMSPGMTEPSGALRSWLCTLIRAPSVRINAPMGAAEAGVEADQVVDQAVEAEAAAIDLDHKSRRAMAST